MKISAITAMEASLVHLKVGVLSQESARSSTQRSNITATNAKLELGPNAAGRLLKGVMEGNAALPISSSTPISATRYVNIISDPDAVAQERNQNLRPSMSQSGDSDLDITMPDSPLGQSTSVLQLKIDADEPLMLQNLLDQFDFQVPSPNEWLRVETALNQHEQYPSLSPEQSNAPVLETNLGSPPQGFVFIPNRTKNTPPNSVPTDIPYTEDVQRLAELATLNEHQGVIETEKRQDDNSQHSISDLMDHFERVPEPVEDRKPGNFETFELEEEYLQKALQHSADELNLKNSRHNIDQLLHHINLSFQ